MSRGRRRNEQLKGVRVCENRIAKHEALGQDVPDELRAELEYHRDNASPAAELAVLEAPPKRKRAPRGKRAA